MRQLVIILLSLLIFKNKVIGQVPGPRVCLSTTFATHTMSSLKNWEIQTLSTGPVLIVKALDFSNSLITSGEIQFSGHEFNYGFQVGTGATRSTLTFKDASGGGNFDFKVRFNFLAANIGVPLIARRKMEINPSVRVSLIENSFTLQNRVTGDKLFAKSQNIGINPHAAVHQVIWTRIILTALIGYEFQIAGALHDPGNRRLKLVDSRSRNPIKVNGDGFRLGLCLGYDLSKKSK